MQIQVADRLATDQLSVTKSTNGMGWHCDHLHGQYLFLVTWWVQGSLRTRETIEKFKQVPAQPGTTNPLLVYFGTLLQRGQLNAFESVELSRLVLGQNKKALLDGWFKEGKVHNFASSTDNALSSLH